MKELIMNALSKSFMWNNRLEYIQVEGDKISFVKCRKKEFTEAEIQTLIDRITDVFSKLGYHHHSTNDWCCGGMFSSLNDVFVSNEWQDHYEFSNFDRRYYLEVVFTK